MWGFRTHRTSMGLGSRQSCGSETLLRGSARRSVHEPVVRVCSLPASRWSGVSSISSWIKTTCFQRRYITDVDRLPMCRSHSPLVQKGKRRHFPFRMLPRHFRHSLRIKQTPHPHWTPIIIGVGHRREREPVDRPCIPRREVGSIDCPVGRATGRLSSD